MNPQLSSPNTATSFRRGQKINKVCLTPRAPVTPRAPAPLLFNVLGERRGLPRPSQRNG